MFKDLDKTDFNEYNSEKLFSFIDVNGDEKIEFDEFICIFNDTNMVNDQILIEFMFATIDRDKSGTIDKNELIKFVEDSKVIFSNGELNDLIMNIDTDGNGNVDLEEFKNALNREFNQK